MTTGMSVNVEIAVQPLLKDKVSGRSIPIENANFRHTEFGTVVLAGEKSFFFDRGMCPHYIVKGTTLDGYDRYSFLTLLPSSVWHTDEVIYFVNGGLPEETDGES